MLDEAGPSSYCAGSRQAIFSRRDQTTMSENDVDDIAFLTGSPQEGGFLVSKRAMYEPGSVMVCSQKRACIVVSLGFLAIIGVALIVAFIKPGCPEANYTGEPLPGLNGGSKARGPPPPMSIDGKVFPWTDIRLPIYVQPLYYTLHLQPNFTTNLVKGNVTIIITAIEETQFIVLHGRNLTITYWSLEDKYKQRLKIDKPLVYPHHQQLYFRLSRILHRGSNYSFNLAFEYEFKESLDGFYLSSYDDENGEKRYIGATHFEPTSARSAFPCFDEPQMKARFRFSIVRQQNQFSLFNMPLKTSRQLDDSDLVLDEFEESVEMSSYLVAFVVCDFTSVSNYTANKVKVSVYAPKKMISQANYALRMAMTILEYFEDFFGVAYPLPKQDLIAIPNFGAGAMENWGLITYRETALMFDPQHTSSIAQQRVTVVIAHELAHQWFGNLVTMSWWQDLWLNEGFASFMENLGTGIAEPGWAMNEQFIIEKVQPALALDALMASHPISTPVKNPADIESIFDTISYKKGASIISMLESCVGMPVLKEGLRMYLNRNRYGSADTNDLWEAITKAAENEKIPINVKEVMDTWTLQSGFPLVYVKIGVNSVDASQTRFLECEENATDPNTPLNKTLGYKWHVPLTYISSSNPKEHQVIWMNNTDVHFSIPNDITWIKFNVGQRGFYRVLYDPSGWEMLTNLLLTHPRRISAADRASIIDDAFTLVRAGIMKAKITLDLSLYLINETDYAPWHTALNHLNNWACLLFNHPSYSLMLSYIHSLVKIQYNRLGWEDTGEHLDKLLRTEILLAAVNTGDDGAINEAKRMFADWRNKNITVPPNLRHVVYTTGVRYGTEEDWWHCWRMYNSSSVPSERKLLLRAMAQTRIHWLLQQYLEYTLDGSKIRSQDVLIVLMEVSLNPGGQLAAWRMVRQHWDTISALFGRGSFTMGIIIKAVTSPFTTSFDLNEVENFFQDKDVGPGSRSLSQAIETIRLNIQWQKDNQQQVTRWLRFFSRRKEKQ